MNPEHRVFEQIGAVFCKDCKKPLKTKNVDEEMFRLIVKAQGYPFPVCECKVAA